MPQSLAQIYLPIVFSTNDRKPWLRDDDPRDQIRVGLGPSRWDLVEGMYLEPRAATRLVKLALSRPGLRSSCPFGTK